MRRLGLVVGQLSATACDDTAVEICSMSIRDSPDRWRHYGFHVDLDGCVRLENLTIMLTGGSGGLCSWCMKGLFAPFSLAGIECTPYTEASAGSAKEFRAQLAQPHHHHPNTCQSMQEVVLHSQNLDETLRLLAANGITTHKGADPKPVGDRSKIAVFMLAGIRLLIVGPRSGPSTELDSALGWMAGTGRPLELVGWLPVVADIDVLAANLKGDCTAIKQAFQPGRRICSLHPEVSHLTGTFAFLSCKSER